MGCIGLVWLMRRSIMLIISFSIFPIFRLRQILRGFMALWSGKLGAWTGLAMCVVAMLRNLYILWEEKKNGKRETNEKRDYIFLAIVYLGIILATIPTYEGFLSLLSVFATSIYTYSIWQKSTKVYKFCGIPVGILWIAYNAYVKSIFGAILEVILLIASVIGYAAEVKSAKGGKI